MSSESKKIKLFNSLFNQQKYDLAFDVALSFNNNSVLYFKTLLFCNIPYGNRYIVFLSLKLPPDYFSRLLKILNAESLIIDYHFTKRENKKLSLKPFSDNTTRNVVLKRLYVEMKSCILNEKFSNFKDHLKNKVKRIIRKWDITPAVCKLFPMIVFTINVEQSLKTYLPDDLSYIIGDYIL